MGSRLARGYISQERTLRGDDQKIRRRQSQRSREKGFKVGLSLDCTRNRKKANVIGTS